MTIDNKYDIKGENMGMKKAKLQDNIQYRLEGDKALLIKVDSEGNIKSIFLNETGKMIVELCDGNKTVNEITDVIIKEFSSELIDEIRADIADFILDLDENGWICYE